MSDEERLKMLRDLLSYLVPRLSAVQVTGNNGGPVTVAELDIAKIMQDPELADAEQRLALAMAMSDIRPDAEPVDSLQAV